MNGILTKDEWENPNLIDYQKLIAKLNPNAENQYNLWLLYDDTPERVFVPPIRHILECLGYIGYWKSWKS